MAVPPERHVDARVVRTRNEVLRTALAVLIEDGWEAVTHSRLAKIAGYSRTTLYTHWPTRTVLLRDAFTRLEQTHHEPTGSLRADLIAELTAFRTAIEDQHIDRALAVLVDLTTSAPEMIDVRDAMVVEGEAVLRALLSPVAHGADLEAAVSMLAGAVLYAAMLYGSPPTDHVIAHAVDITLAGLGRNVA
jgi:AcrR family transcriptional regulator